MKKALITGITGQDGSYLAEFLLGKGYEVHGIVRRVALEDPSRRFSRIAGILGKVKLHPASLESYASIFRVIAGTPIDECYHLAAQSFVAESFEDGFSTLNSNINGTHHVLAALREANPACRFYFAGTSEMFGKVTESPQDERTPFNPRSPYGISKVAGHHLAINYREEYGMHCSSGILFNHESPRRGHEYVTRKISNGVARIKAGRQKDLRLGNLDARRDWGHAADYVDAMWRMLQQDRPDTYVVATGETHSVREFCEIAFSEAGLDYKEWVVADDQFRRPVEAEVLMGNAARARKILGWKKSVDFPSLVREMVHADLKNEGAT
ncbi:MAG: NAD-dependent [Planctomycetota bacterium]|nr:MAG: NAD-dependent [Planctomycetota bacterium]